MKPLTNETLDPLQNLDFWHSMEPLYRIHEWGHARGSAPSAVLAHALLRAITVTPPNVVLPPIVGDVASLNLYAALVAGSGGGKGIARKVSRLAVHTPVPYAELPIGSGEGVTRAFASNEKVEIDKDRFEYRLKWKDQSIMFRSDEVSGLAALNGRSGSTLGAALKQGAMGEGLGNAYADSEKAVIIPDGEYRMTFHVAVQPALSWAMFQDQAGGFPQRFVWAKTSDPSMPPQASPDPEPWTLHTQHWGTDQVILDVPQTVWDLVSNTHRAKARGEHVELDGHALLTREKIAAGVMLLDNRTAVTEMDWEIAGMFAEHSDIARQLCLDALQREKVLRDQEKGDSIARTSEAVENRAEHRVKEKVLALIDEDRTLTVGKLTQEFHSRDRERVRDVCRKLAASGIYILGSA